MKKKSKSVNRGAALLDVVALLEPSETTPLARGQVGTVVELLDDANVLVEFSDDSGRAFAIAACPVSGILVLHYVRQAA